MWFSHARFVVHSEIVNKFDFTFITWSCCFDRNFNDRPLSFHFSLFSLSIFSFFLSLWKKNLFFSFEQFLSYVFFSRWFCVIAFLFVLLLVKEMEQTNLSSHSKFHLFHTNRNYNRRLRTWELNSFIHNYGFEWKRDKLLLLFIEINSIYFSFQTYKYG